MSVKYSAWGNTQFFDANGNPAVGWKIFSYAAGSSTALSTYTTAAGTVAQSNPIIIDTLGTPTIGQIWLTAGLTYKFVLTDENGVVKDTQDNISGVNDSSNTTSQWQASGVTPTYISASSFTLVGDQTTEFHVGRQAQFTTTAGTVYGVIATTAYTSLTTVTMTMIGAQVLDAGLSAVNLSILRADNPALPVTAALINRKHGADIASAATINLTNATGDLVDVTGAVAITAITLADGYERTVRFTGAPVLTNGASLVLPGSANITTEAGDIVTFRGYPAGVVRVANYERISGAALVAVTPVPVRQTVLSGPVDSSGFSAFVGATGSATVTATGTLKATAAAGGDANYTGSIVNPSWTGLSTNGTMYLYLDITSAGVVTTGSTTLAPTYRWGGADVTTSGQNTFNIQAMTMKAGNGSAAVQVYRVFVGEVTVAAGVVSAITWYSLMGQYRNEQATLAYSTAYSFNHNIGHADLSVSRWYECITTEVSYAVGDRIYETYGDSNGTQANGGPFWTTRNRCGLTIGDGGGTTLLRISDKTNGLNGVITPANWKLGFIVKRGW